MFPARFAPILFSCILSGLMSCMVSGIATFRVVGPAAGFFGQWMTSWAFAWMISFPVVMVVAPLTRRIVSLLIRPEV